MSKFKINTPIAVNKEEEVKAEQFGKDADKHVVQNTYQVKPKPTKSFSVPLTEDELHLLRKIANMHDRSQRYVARKLLVKILNSELSNPQL